MSLAAYRSVMRAARTAFQGDAHVLAAAQTQIRQTFQENSSLESAKIQDAIKHAEDVAKILRENVVQGKQANAEDNTYKLRIHEHTERGDNDSILTAGIGSKGGSCGCK
ncbi:Mitochondrial zinc maintenance protein 1 [Cladobotryum mycophilum]|uniref:Mitochondrial zinc maintenance protein 1, mitochondrial n=1 Tax=Cladobotryum mycophilum TaxID=491253 RepID=A0ABR0T3V0_9HYPO